MERHKRDSSGEDLMIWGMKGGGKQRNRGGTSNSMGYVSDITRRKRL